MQIITKNVFYKQNKTQKKRTNLIYLLNGIKNIIFQEKNKHKEV